MRSRGLKSLLMFATLLPLMGMSTCSRHPEIDVPRAPSVAGCEWVQPIYLSREAQSALRERSLFVDIKAIADHNRLYEQFCK
jgi:hypothetical protein